MRFLTKSCSCRPQQQQEQQRHQQEEQQEERVKRPWLRSTDGFATSAEGRRCEPSMASSKAPPQADEARCRPPDPRV